MIDSITYKIANHLFSVEGANTVALLRSMPGFPIFECTTDKKEWVVHTGCHDLATQGEVLYHSDFDTSVVYCELSRSGNEYYYLMRMLDSNQGPFVFRYDGKNDVYATETDDPMLLRFALWMAFSLMSAPHGVLPIHASTIVHQGKAVFFLGESGTGKSTHTRLWMEHIEDSHLLNDDSPMLSIENGVPIAWGSPWSGKTHCYHDKSFPLAAIVRLQQAPQNSISRLSLMEAFAALHPSCPPALAYDNHYTDFIVGLVSDTVQAIPAFRLLCLPDAAAAQTSHNAIFAN